MKTTLTAQETVDSNIPVMVTFDATLDAFSRSWGYTRKTNARHIMNALASFPWLSNQIRPNVLKLVLVEMGRVS